MKKFFPFRKSDKTLFLDQEYFSSHLKRWVYSYNKFCNTYLQDTLLHKEHNGIIPGRDLQDELILFEFVLRIGAFITYGIIDAMRYHESKEIKKELDNIINKNELVSRWLDNAIKLSFYMHLRK